MASSEFFYSRDLKRFIAYEPVKMTDRVARAASEARLDLNWDDEGRVNNISYIEAKRLLANLAATMLSPREFWIVQNEAVREKNKLVLESLQSSSGTEWLDAIFKKDSNGQISITEHPTIQDSNGKFEFTGSNIEVDQPEGRPGWFSPVDNTNLETGMSIAIELTREKGSPSWSETTWKYWSTFQTEKPMAGIRGYVTSSGTPSLDLDIPPTAKEPLLFVRECRQAILEPTLDPVLSEKAGKMKLHGLRFAPPVVSN
jgi:hypothetical protein